jgi:transglutaminase-like putative cysteine protease
MIYQVRHRTTYDYKDAVSVSHHVLRLTPRNVPGQACRIASITIEPAPPVVNTHDDYFGNEVSAFTLYERHNNLTVDARSVLEVQAKPEPDFRQSPPWESGRDSIMSTHTPEGLEACQFVFDSERVNASAELANYARESFLNGRPLLDAALDLTHRIHEDFRFDTKATVVTTPVETFFEKRRGVCQDFAHLQVGCLRSLGLPARYVSGYLRTTPRPGRPRLIGADASHAWCSIWCPVNGWVDFDPTNNCVPTDGHITIAWGRDYNDVCPIHGVLLGGSRHTLDVGVDVVPVEDGSADLEIPEKFESPAF